MSLVVCSSAQDKYQSVGSQVTTQGQIQPSIVLAPGMQNPVQFTNNINPVMVIPANSEVALKDISFYKSSVFRVGINVSVSVWVGELLRSRWGLTEMRGLADVTTFPIPVPLQPGIYNSSTFANMLEDMLNQYISYPDLVGNISVRPWSSTGESGVSDKGYIFQFEKGLATGAPADRSASIENVWAAPALRNQYTWTKATKTYLSTAAGFGSNIGLITDMPLSLNGGEMTWDVTNCTGGWRICLTRPLTPRKNAPNHFEVAVGDTEDNTGFADIVLEYATRTDGAYADTENTFRIFHAVINANNRFTHREVEYYNNTDVDFTPLLTVPADGLSHQFMHQASAATFTDLTANPTSITIKMFGEDSYVELTANAVQEVMTDSRLCIAGNAGVLAQTPTRNMFIKPLGTTSHALYPKISLFADGESAVLTTYTGITSNSYEYPLDDALNPAGPGAAASNFPISPTGSNTSGSSFWGRVRFGDMGVGPLMSIHLRNMDRQTPYQSDSAVAQKQYVGLDGPTGALPPVRIGEGEPYIPSPCIGTPAGSVAYTVGLITIPPAENLRNLWDTDEGKGVYGCNTSDVSELLGFRNTNFVAQSLIGNQYLYTNKLSATSTAAPTNTLGAFWGWYAGSTSVPQYTSGGSIFIRCPTLTHQSFNFGKGIPSKIIASIPPESFNSTFNTGEGFYAPSEMTYLTLNNTEPLHFNDITIELVDKNEQLVDGLFDRNTTATLHFRKAK
tara:strand:- start:17 stop:2215 length:2199 start_codon:yes stop_codon:yes gene_type:complete